MKTYDIDSLYISPFDITRYCIPFDFCVLCIVASDTIHTGCSNLELMQTSPTSPQRSTVYWDVNSQTNKMIINICIINSRYIAAQHSTILHTVHHLRMWNFGHTLNLRKTPISRPNGWAMGVFRELFGEKWPRDIGSELQRARSVSFCPPKRTCARHWKPNAQKF